MYAYTHKPMYVQYITAYCCEIGGLRKHDKACVRRPAYTHNTTLSVVVRSNIAYTHIYIHHTPVFLRIRSAAPTV